jgi:hypothetical protein
MLDVWITDSIEPCVINSKEYALQKLTVAQLVKNFLTFYGT